MNTVFIFSRDKTVQFLCLPSAGSAYTMYLFVCPFGYFGHHWIMYLLKFSKNLIYLETMLHLISVLAKPQGKELIKESFDLPPNKYHNVYNACKCTNS